MRKIFTDNLPKIQEKRNNGKIDWKNAIGYNVHFIYDDIEDNLEIIEYIKPSKVKIKYKNIITIISTCHLINCKIGNKLFKINTSEFKVEIGQTFKDKKRDLIIIDRRIDKIIKRNGKVDNRKYYKYKCNICGWTEGWIVETDLLTKNNGCSCCAGRTVVEGINDIPTTDPWMVKYFQGGYEEAKLFTHGSNKYIYPICPECGKIKNNKVLISSISYYNGISCICSDNFSIPEKIMSNVLYQLKDNKKIKDFIWQYSKKNNNWCNKYKYDFYFEYNNESYIIETHGGQHYREAGGNWYPLNEIKENDKNKKELAIKNGIKPENYIIIDCRYSEFEFIKNNIIDSRLNELFDLNNIDWEYSNKFSLTNITKNICLYLNKNKDKKYKDKVDFIQSKYKVSESFIIKCIAKSKLL